MKHIKNEILSAYANKEITDSEKQNIATHLAACARCRKMLDVYLGVRQQLTAEAAVSAGAEIKETAVAGMREPVVIRNNPRRWLKPALVAVPVLAAAVIVLSLILTGSPLTPEQVLAKAASVQQEMHLFNDFSSTTDFYDPQTNKWKSDILWEAKFAPGTCYQKFTLLQYPDQEGYEMISMEDTSYYRAFPRGIITGLQLAAIGNHITHGREMVSYNDNQTPRTSSSLSEVLAAKLGGYTEVVKMPDERIDGVVCYHYHATASRPKQILSIDTIKNSPSWNKLSPAEQDALIGAAKIVIEQQQKAPGTNLIDTEWWIAKDNFQVLQKFSLSNKVTQDPLTGETIKEMQWRSTTTYTYPDNPVIKAPLDETGNLLPEWHLFK
ncbi:MAG: zf-HC2 domain-containing protein [Dehalococcoidales bacterium]|nr:zf-HC2 domain-containing protein [Dehalococcoidales bacterium]